MTAGFKRYIERKRVTNTPAGDFTADAKVDGSLPNAESWQELEAYLLSKGVPRDVRTIARQVWRGYERSLKRQ